MRQVTEENYLKAIFHQMERTSGQPAYTSDLSVALGVRAASVSEMLQRLAQAGWLQHRRYQGVVLTSKGRQKALGIVRKHRLWEHFLVEKLRFTWDQVHAVAEQLEHIDSDLLIDRLDAFLGYPRTDPHGDPIPDRNGRIRSQPMDLLATLKPNEQGCMVGVLDQQPSFFRHLKRLQLQRGHIIRIVSISDYDRSMELVVNGKRRIVISHQTANHILVSRK